MAIRLVERISRLEQRCTTPVLDLEAASHRLLAKLDAMGIQTPADFEPMAARAELCRQLRQMCTT